MTSRGLASSWACESSLMTDDPTALFRTSGYRWRAATRRDRWMFVGASVGVSGPYSLEEYYRGVRSDRDVPAATTERPVVLWARQSTREGPHRHRDTEQIRRNLFALTTCASAPPRLVISVCRSISAISGLER